MANLENYKNIQSLLRNNTKFIALGDSPVEELNLKYKGRQDLDELRYILGHILAYPSTELADLHRDANRLGEYDLKENDLKQKKLEEFNQYKETDIFCPDCGFIKQEQTVSVCRGVREVHSIGHSIFLYFHTLVGLSILLLSAFLIYGIYALTTNVMAARQYRSVFDFLAKDNASQKSFEGVLILSLGSKQLNARPIDQTYYNIQCWIGVGLVIAWGLLFVLIKYRERVGEENVVREIKSVADFSLSIENIPLDMTEDELEKQLTEYQKQLIGTGPETIEDIQIVKLNLAKPFYLDERKFNKKEEIRRVNELYGLYTKKFIEWIKFRVDHDYFPVGKSERLKAYKDYETIKQQQVTLFEQMTEEVKKYCEKEMMATTVAFVTLRSTEARKILLQKNSDDISTNIRDFLICCSKRKKFILKDKRGHKIQTYIKEAPEPEDIIWTNLGQSKCRLITIKVISFFVTLLILCGSFAAVYALSKVQVDLNSDTDSSFSYISFLISLVIPIFNLIIQQVLKRISYLERDYTTTMQQASIAVKGTIASLINSILVPILVNWYFKKNLYGVNGLAFDVFLLSITSSFFPSLIRIFDVYFWLTRAIEWAVKRPMFKLKLNQNQLNSLTEYMEFEAGYDMIPIVNSYLFTCFFASLQPIIIVFAFTGMVLMYWTQKYSLFNRCKRPAPGDTTINTAMYSLIYLGPLFYSLGSFCWSHFFEKGFIGLAPNLTASILSFIIYLLPYGFIVDSIRGKRPDEEHFYEHNRIYFPSQYDRLNPSTSREAVRQYIDFVAEYKKQLEKKGPEQIAEIERRFISQMRRGRITNREKYISTLGEMMGGLEDSHNKMMISNKYDPENKTTNPKALENLIFSRVGGHALRTPVQNWVTEEELNQYNLKNELHESHKSLLEDEMLPHFQFANRKVAHSNKNPAHLYGDSPSTLQNFNYANEVKPIFEGDNESINPLTMSARGVAWWNPQDPRISPINPFVSNNPLAYNNRGFSLVDAKRSSILDSEVQKYKGASEVKDMGNAQHRKARLKNEESRPNQKPRFDD